MPLTRGGEFAAGLDQGREAALNLYRVVSSDPRFVPGPTPELDIVVWAVRAPSLAESSQRAQEVFDRAAKLDLHLALAHLPARFFPNGGWPGADPSATVTCLRSVLMKPEHLAWADEISRRLRDAL